MLWFGRRRGVPLDGGRIPQFVPCGRQVKALEGHSRVGCRTFSRTCGRKRRHHRFRSAGDPVLEQIRLADIHRAASPHPPSEPPAEQGVSSTSCSSRISGCRVPAADEEAARLSINQRSRYKDSSPASISGRKKRRSSSTSPGDAVDAGGPQTGRVMWPRPASRRSGRTCGKNSSSRVLMSRRTGGRAPSAPRGSRARAAEGDSRTENGDWGMVHISPASRTARCSSTRVRILLDGAMRCQAQSRSC